MRIVHHYCPACDRNVPAVQNQCNHVLHLILSLITAGVWVIVWVFCALTQTSHCQRCGTRTVGGKIGTQAFQVVGLLAVFVLVVLGTAVGVNRFRLNRDEITAGLVVLSGAGALCWVMFKPRRSK